MFATCCRADAGGRLTSAVVEDYVDWTYQNLGKEGEKKFAEGEIEGLDEYREKVLYGLKCLDAVLVVVAIKDVESGAISKDCWVFSGVVG